jgi:nucleotide-binding universal stress UspA family protein
MTTPHTKILVASDGSDASRLAIDQAVHLADLQHADLHLIHVGLLSAWVQPDTLSPTQYARLKQEAQSRLDAEVAYVEDVGGTLTEAHLRMGTADSEILRLSEELEVDLLVVGNRGQNAIKRIVLGSDSENIVRYAPCTVMVVRERA